MAFESKSIGTSPKHLKYAVPIKIENSMIDTDKLIVIGSSTGGTEALREILTRLPKQIPPVVIVQHIPAGFSKAFAERMDSLCPFKVKEAAHGDVLTPGHVFVAPGGLQMSIVYQNNQYVLNVNDDAPVNRHKPSVDYLFLSASKLSKKKVISLILTGMGSDGAKGMLELKKQGAVTIAQNEESCVVYGMPQAAVKLGCVDHVRHLKDIPSELLNQASSLKKSKVS
jgi:two-component system chemotaxis response regulator CheB